MKRAKLIVASSEASADMLYLTGFRAPDAFAFAEVRGRTALLLSDLEIDRARVEAGRHEIVPLSAIEANLRGKRRKTPAYARSLAAFLETLGADRATVPGDFPLRLARELRKLGVRVRPAKGAFAPGRLTKNAEEIRAVAHACRIAEAGVVRAIEVLTAATIRRDGRLAWAGRALTAEVLRAEIATAVVRAGGESRGDQIVAGGEQACDPHCRGHGPLRARELIILDVFPRHTATGFFGDITRTVVRGPATDAQRQLWNLCLEGQQRALAAVRPGAGGAAIQDDVRAFFRDAGYPNEVADGRWRGFFHGLGHGLGLEIHEEPRLSAATLEPGHVVTIEPGLYWPGVGGVRHEDVVAITTRGKRLLTTLPKPFELRAG